MYFHCQSQLTSQTSILSFIVNSLFALYTIHDLSQRSSTLERQWF